MKTDLGAKIFQKIEDDKRFFEERKKKAQEEFNEFFEGYLLENSGKIENGKIEMKLRDLAFHIPKKVRFPNLIQMIRDFCAFHGFLLTENAILHKDSFSDVIQITIPRVFEE